MAEPRVDPPESLLHSRYVRFDAERAALDTRSLRLSRWRLMLGAALAASLIWLGYGGGAAAGAVAIASACALGAVVLRHVRVDEAAQWAKTLADINADALARLKREWSAVTDWLPAANVSASHPYAADLDVSGHASLLRLLGRARSPLGDRELTRWLLEPAPVSEIATRQAAVTALAAMVDVRQHLAGHALATLRMSQPEVERFLQWCEGEPWLRRRAFLYVLALVLAIATVSLLLLNTSGKGQGWWVSPALVGILLSLAVQRRLAHAFEDASWQAALRGWRALLGVVAPLGDAVPALARLQTPGVVDPAAVRAFDGLDRILGFASLRHTPLLHWPIHALTMWDMHVWWALDGWQRRHGPRVRTWLEGVATVEAVSALAGLAHDHPQWCMPSVGEDVGEIRAREMGHPLIAPAACVTNDTTLGPPGTTLLVTGSNMSGKSTFLRAIGANGVLAQAGGPVCATAWQMPPLTVVTSMRLADSLEDGVSFFMASLARLKLVVEAAREATTRPERPHVLYLLDELLSGTNTAERAVAVRAVVKHLVASRAIGALTTHDLGLADAPEFRAHATLVHFRERVSRDASVTMSFDYRLREGLATSTNALALMEVVGLGEVIRE